MRLTYTSMKNMFLDATNNSGSSDTTLSAFFKRQLGAKYQLALAELQMYKTQKSTTDTTVTNQQYYKNPVDLVAFENVTVTVGSIAYTLQAVSSQSMWNKINQTLISTTTIPQFYFPRRDDFGIWPIPQSDSYTINEYYLYRQRDLTQDDYTTGTVTLTNGSTTVTGSGTTFTAGMVNRWIQATDDGYWYRIASYTSTTELTLDRKFMGTTGSGLSFTIGETPEIPEEGHDILVWGVLSDYYGMFKKDSSAQIWWNNMFWTGDGQNGDRTGRNIQGGLIGLRNRYASRDNSGVIKHVNLYDYKNTYIWGQVLSAS
jgi:hypothetical protein